jgi:Uma2 family endonuclease
MDWDNMPQPDCDLFIQPECGGQARIDADGYLQGAPELIAEVASSSATYELHDKLRVYRRNGVREYIVRRVLDRQIDWFVHREGRYDRITPAADRILRSTVFPGLWLDPAALVREDFDTLLDVLQQGLDSPEHTAFKAQLQQARAEPAG